MTRKLPKEIWKPVPGFPAYWISTWGRLRLKLKWDDKNNTPRVATSKITRPKGNVQLRRGRKSHWFRIAQLVLITFVKPRPSSKHMARHLDDNTKNNWVENLAWGTAKDNYLDAVRNGKDGRGSATQQARINTATGKKKSMKVRRKMSIGAKRGWVKRRRNQHPPHMPQSAL